MSELKFHSLGEHEHLESLKKKYDSLRRKTAENKKLSLDEKNTAMQNLMKSFEEEKRNSKNNLY
ncbi:hypothetical protein [Mariniflexile maritimum]|jgi:hypothetical protein|uniref:hypothetical protein n=1 Tax=Mariniflexile maritimum TaxID=2682493 RepID=UPI0012F6DC05|nr:hypothetical protein [Mariniflexile maritimum]MCB0450770.1 hypothetical protein [Confluentibacter sp.]